MDVSPLLAPRGVLGAQALAQDAWRRLLLGAVEADRHPARVPRLDHLQGLGHVDLIGHALL
eukprot:5666646-Alexandrium_andersonii.AAC.1